MIAVPGPENSIRHFLHVLWRHKGKELSFFVLVVGLAAALTWWLPRMYRSEGELLLRLGRENMAMDPTATVGNTSMLMYQESRENEINSTIEILRSRVLLDQVVDTISPDVILGRVAWQPAKSLENKTEVQPAVALLPADADSISAANAAAADTSPQDGAASPDDHESAVRRLIKSLDIEAVRKSNVVQITCDAPSPALAQATVKTLIHYFLDDYIRLNRTPGAQEFLSQQTEDMRQRLQAKEEELRQLKDATGLAEPEGRRTIVVNRIGRLEDELLETSSSLASAEAQVKQLHEQVDALPPTQITEQTVGFANDASDGMRQQLYALQLREQEMAARVTADHPQLKEVREQIADAKKVLDQEPRRTETKTGPSKPYEELKVELLKQEPVLAALLAKKDKLQAQLTAERQTLDKLNADELRVASLEREVQLNEANYRKYIESLEQARIDRAMAQEGKSNISIMQPATLELKPVKPNVLQNMALAVIVGLLGGAGLGFAAESWSASHHVAENGHARLPEVVLNR